MQHLLLYLRTTFKIYLLVLLKNIFIKFDSILSVKSYSKLIIQMKKNWK